MSAAEKPPSTAIISSMSTKRTTIEPEMYFDRYEPRPIEARYTPITRENCVIESPSR